MQNKHVSVWNKDGKPVAIVDSSEAEYIAEMDARMGDGHELVGRYPDLDLGTAYDLHLYCTKTRTGGGPITTDEIDKQLDLQPATD